MAVSECHLSSPDSATRTEAFLQLPPADRTFNTFNYLGGADSDDEAPPTEDVMEVKKGAVFALVDPCFCDIAIVWTDSVILFLLCRDDGGAVEGLVNAGYEGPQC